MPTSHRMSNRRYASNQGIYKLPARSQPAEHPREQLRNRVTPEPPAAK